MQDIFKIHDKQLSKDKFKQYLFNAFSKMPQKTQKQEIDFVVSFRKVRFRQENFIKIFKKGSAPSSIKHENI